MAKQQTGQPKKRHHRVKKLVKLALLAGAAYGAKRVWDKRQGSKAPRP